MTDKVFDTAPVEKDNQVRPRPLGMAAFAGALSDWEELPQVVENIYKARALAKDRPAPDVT